MCWQLWQMSQVYRCRPSDLVGLEDVLERFWFDRGIRLFGVYLTNQADAAADNAGRSASGGNRAAMEQSARDRTLAKLLGEDMTKSNAGYRKM